MIPYSDRRGGNGYVELCGKHGIDRLEPDMGGHGKKDNLRGWKQV